MATGRVTKRSVDAAPPGFLWDDELRGFGLKVTPTGGRSYVFQYRLGGREAPARRYTIGKHGSPWTPTTARQEAERLAMMVRRGVDPRDDQRERRREAVDLAFRPYAQRFLDIYVTSEWPASHTFAESILRLHVTPVLGDKALPRIARGDITEVLDRLPASKPALKRNVYAVVRRLFRWAVGRGDLERSPLEGFEGPASVASRDRVLADEELGLVWKAAADLGYPFGPMVRLLILTGQRREEVAGLKWQELDRPSATWTLPADRSKNGKVHLIPLSEPVVRLLDALANNAARTPLSNSAEEKAPQIALWPDPFTGCRDKDERESAWPKNGFVFTTTGKTAASGHSRAKRRLDAALLKLLVESAAGNLQSDNGDVQPLPAWRLHDLRRTLATGLQRIGIRFEVTEAVLNHVSGARSGVAGVYQRHDWRDEKREALNKWADAVSHLLAKPADKTSSDAGNVTPLRRRLG